MSDLPPFIRDHIQSELQGLWGASVRLRGARPVGGGCINHASVVEVAGHPSVFVKWNASAPAGMLAAEAAGLRALRSKASGVVVPEPYAVGLAADSDAPAQWIAMEYVAAGRPGPNYDRALADGLAQMALERGAEWGWESDNFIGTLPQPNDLVLDDAWSTFWVERRLRPQIEMALGPTESGESALRGSGGTLAQTDRAWWADVSEAARRWLQDRARAQGEPARLLLHGDLWSGNVFADSTGRPVLVDPAVYVGDGAVDIAMARLFGGFSGGFFHAWEDAAGVSVTRSLIEVYQLYPVLVHANLFGGGYWRSATELGNLILGFAS